MLGEDVFEELVEAIEECCSNCCEITECNSALCSYYCRVNCYCCEDNRINSKVLK